MCRVSAGGGITRHADMVAFGVFSWSSACEVV